MKRLVLLVILAAVLPACGWQLRGYELYKQQGDSTLTQLHLRSTSDNRELQAILKRQLKDLGITLDAEAPVKLVLHEEQLERRPLAYSGTGVPLQYQLIISLRFEYLSATTKKKYRERKIIARRQYDFDTALVVAKNEEERVLLDEMRGELASRIIAALNQRRVPTQWEN